MTASEQTATAAPAVAEVPAAEAPKPQAPAAEPATEASEGATITPAEGSPKADAKDGKDGASVAAAAGASEATSPTSAESPASGAVKRPLEKEGSAAAAADAAADADAAAADGEVTKRARAEDGSAVVIKGKDSKTKFELLRSYSSISIDGADADKKLGVQHATTNPSILLDYLKSPAGAPWIKTAIEEVNKSGPPASEELLIKGVMDRVIAYLAKNILAEIPGDVSIEVDPQLAFDEEATVARALELVEIMKACDVDVSRVAIKVPATQAGVEACRKLTGMGYKVNLTLIFNLVQAVAGSRANATYVSPFVGRITDFYKGQDMSADPGVEFVKQVYRTLKSIGSKTTVMAASFRRVDQCMGLAGCDCITISVPFLKEMHEAAPTDAEREAMPVLTPEQKPEQKADGENPAWIQAETGPNAATFLWEVNADPMATKLLSEGIVKFYKAWQEATQLLKQLITEHTKTPTA